MSRRKKYRIFLCTLIVSGLAVLGYFSIQSLKESIPGAMKVRELEQLALDFGWLITEEVTPELANVSANAFDSQKYQVHCSLFGVIPLKTIEVQQVETEPVYTGGIPIGLYLETQGVFVIDYGSIEGKDGLQYEPARQVVQPGDYILAVNSQSVSEKEELSALIGEAGQGEVILTLRRADEVIDVRLKTVETADGSYKAGIWVRDNTQGIGTLTFVTTDREFGALGHGINDVDTGDLLAISEGALYETKIQEIKRGENGKPGEISGTISYQKDCKYGTILENLPVGIFGTCSNGKLLQESGEQEVEIAFKQEVKEGKAFIRSAVDGTMKDYEIEVTGINYKESDINKGIVFRVTDERLLSYTGGIVQGMSGSPILQEGKLIGAVTHVFVQDSSKGFGIFIENMLDYVDS